MKWTAAFLVMSFIIFSPSAFSRDTKHMLSIQEALQSDAYKGRLDPDIKLVFGSKKGVKIKRKLGNFTTNKKTNSFNKTDRIACEWALLSALLTLQQRAVKEGGNAVINIVSYYKKNKFTSTTKFECHAGAFVTGVALNADVAKIAK